MPRNINDPVSLPAASFILPDLLQRIGTASQGSPEAVDALIRQAIAECIVYAMSYGNLPAGHFLSEDGAAMQSEEGLYLILE